MNPGRQWATFRGCLASVHLSFLGFTNTNAVAPSAEVDALPARKRRHHYVWREYLRAWALDEHVFCLASGHITRPKLTSVAWQRDFYAFQTLSRTDLEFLKYVVGLADPPMREAHEQTVRNYLRLQKLLEISASRRDSVPEAGELEDLLRSNVIEDWHSSIESSAAPALSALRSGRCDFVQDAGVYLDFVTFLATQYLRTEKMQRQVLSRDFTLEPGAAERMWPLLVHVLAANMAWTLIRDRPQYGLQLLRSPPGTEFCTSDQPVFNLLGGTAASDTPPAETQLFYPVSPRYAVVLGRTSLPSINQPEVSPPERIRALNDQVVAHARHTIFAGAKEVLLPWAAAGEVQPLAQPDPLRRAP